MEMSSKPSTVEFEDGSAYVDDDVFFAEIRKQILVLTADNEDFPETKTSSNQFTGSVTKRGLDCLASDISCHANVSSSLGYISWLGNKNTNSSVPASLAKLWENSSTGTGVFIPRAVNSSTNYRPRRMNYDRRRTYKRADNKYT